MVGAVALVQFNVGGGMQFVTDKVWISDFVLGTSVRYHVGMDGLGLFMMLLTSVGHRGLGGRRDPRRRASGRAPTSP